MMHLDFRDVKVWILEWVELQYGIMVKNTEGSEEPDSELPAEQTSGDVAQVVQSSEGKLKFGYRVGVSPRGGFLNHRRG